MRIKPPGFRLGAASGVAFSSTGQFLGQVGRRVAIYGVPTRKIVTRSEWHYPHPAAMTFGAKDDWFAVRSTTGAMVVAALADGHPLTRLPPTTDVADDSPLVTGSADYLVEACSSGTLRVRHVQGLRVEYLEQHPGHMLGALASSQDGSRWALAINAKQLDAPSQPPCRLELRGWPFSTSTRQVVGEQFGFVHAVTLTEQTGEIALLEQRPGSRANTISVIGPNGTVLRENTSDEWASHRGFARSPDGQYLIVGTKAGHTLLDDNLRVVGRLAGEYSSDARFSPAGHLLALGYWGHGLVLSVGELASWFTDQNAKIGDAAV